LDQAEKAFKEVTVEFPSHPLFYYASFQLGNVQFQKRNVAEATAYYSTVIKGNILNLLGEVYFRSVRCSSGRRSMKTPLGI